MKYVLTLTSLLFLLVSFNASATTNHLKTVGKAEMRWLLFPLYQVELKTADGRYQQNQYPQTLDILYRRNIDKQDLLTATDNQWQRLGIGMAQRQQWITQLGSIWPSIKRGDKLGFNIAADGSNNFSYNGKNIGGVNDAKFGESFLAIWLSPKTSQPGVRQLLIGLTN
ncbi:chalcone isomerase family protein [Leucothrix arctica]|uniref:Chalcone isomerase domain-containing protein n=1 Tax=Leucothrix arctica TaxID=1481894 RepID=A0A317C5R7_9GAMM|nr:chalcone isomerase family protein [Leucothrix arctica]PWQ93976.1 hypothetical protein DKT75_20495 [Leucothrix arctica]